MASWKSNKKGYNVSVLIKRANHIFTSNSVNAVSYMNCLSLIVSSIRFDNNVPESYHRNLAKQAIGELVQQNTPWTSENLIRKISDLEKEYISKPFKKLILLTTLSARYATVMKPIKLGNLRITFSRYKPKGFDTQTAIEASESYILGKMPRTYTYVSVSLNARSEYEAVTKALNGLNYLRGLWNFLLNYNRYRVFHIGREQPVNSLIIGPLHTVHNSDGSAAATVIWYESNYLQPISASSIANNWTRIRKNDTELRRWISRQPHSSKLEDAFRKYAQALDSWDMYDSFLKLWSLLEYLLDTYHNDKIVNRLLFLIKDKDYQTIILQNLRNFRNSYVHTAESSDEVESYVYQLKNYVEYLLQFHTLKEYAFSSIEEAVLFLDNPKNSNKLSLRISKLKRDLKNTKRLAFNLNERKKRKSENT